MNQVGKRHRDIDVDVKLSIKRCKDYRNDLEIVNATVQCMMRNAGRATLSPESRTKACLKSVERRDVGGDSLNCSDCGEPYLIDPIEYELCNCSTCDRPVCSRCSILWYDSLKLSVYANNTVILQDVLSVGA